MIMIIIVIVVVVVVLNVVLLPCQAGLTEARLDFRRRIWLSCRMPPTLAAYPPNIGYVIRASTGDKHVLRVKGTNA